MKHTAKSIVALTAWVVLSSGGLEATGAEVNEFLDMDISQLMSVMVTSASKKAQNLSDVPAAIFVVSQEDIRRSGATTIPEVLAMAPGIQVAQISASKWSVSSRGFPGFTSNKLLVLIDGRSIYSPGYSGSFWDSQNTMLEDVDRIEVIRGPGGTVWGANAVNGIINIITKSAKDTQGGLVRMGAGSQGMFTSGARYGGKVGETAHGRFYLTANDYPSNTLMGGDADAHDGWRPAQGGFRLDGAPHDHAEWTLQGDLLDNDEEMTIFPDWLDHAPYLAIREDAAAITRSNLLGRWRQEVDADSALTVQAYYDHNNFDMEDDSYRQQFETVDLDLQYETSVGKRQNLTTGAGFRSVQSDFDDNFILHFPDRNDALYSAFLQDEINLLPDLLWLTLGSKYEHNDYSGSEWQPSAKLLWKPKPRHSLWASAARAVRTPTPMEQYGRVVVGAYPTPLGTGTAAFIGNPDFASETVVAYETGYRWQASPTLSFDLALFYNDYDELYSLQQGLAVPNIELQFVNGIEGGGYGFETAVDWKAASWLSFVFTYSYLELDLSLRDASGFEPLVDYYSHLSPTHQASARASIALARDWQLNLWLRYVDAVSCRDSSNLLASTPVDIDAYTLFNANLIWTPIKNLEVMLAVQNLLNSSQLQYAMEYVTPPTEIERGVYGKVTWRF